MRAGGREFEEVKRLRKRRRVYEERSELQRGWKYGCEERSDE